MDTPAGAAFDVTATPAWSALISLPRPPHLRDLFAADPGRTERLTFHAGDLRVDLSKHLVDDRVLSALVAVARASGCEARRDAMFRGEKVNASEQRPALHTALRAPVGERVLVDGHDVVPDVHDVLSRAAAFARRVRDGQWRGVTGRRIRTIVNIGIGGSDLGPAMAYEALRSYVHPAVQCRFVSNVDGADISTNLVDLDPAETLVVVASKSFTTLETLTNARTARDWLVRALGPDAVRYHFAAVSTNAEAAAAFGIGADQMFGLWDWVGGRYSVSSAVALPLMIAIGPEHFADFLGGMRAIDEHFCHTPLERNVPVLMAMLGIWYTSVLGAQTKAVVPYAHELRRFPAYLQQLEMESNGKSVRLDGTPVTVPTGPVVWGEPGTNGQHSFFQLLHQGTQLVPVDFIGFARSNHPLQHHHDLLVANLLAQGEALAFGQRLEEVAGDGVPEHLAPHRVLPGNRPSTTILAERLTPNVLGQLIALYEHVVFVQGCVWGVNSFDQWGVELGKTLASRIMAELSGHDEPDHDASTTAMIRWYRERRLG